MNIERKIPENEISRQNECLLPGHKLLLAGPASLMSLCCSEKESLLVSKIKFDEDLMRSVFTEWYSIYKLLTNMVGESNVVVAKTNIIIGNRKKDSSVDWKVIDLPDKLSFNAKEIPFFSLAYSSWPRDAYTIIGDKIFKDECAWSAPQTTKFSELGEQGKVLVKNKAVLVTSDLWKNSRKDIEELRKDGFKIGCLPKVNEAKQNYKFIEEHIDGHSALIEDKNGKLVLLVAESYSYQGNGSRKQIRQAAETVGARMIELADRNLPPLALNLIQFEDRSIVCTDSRARDLAFTLECLVGEDKVFETEVPLINIPKLGKGGIRCLTNILPPVLNSLL